MTRQTLAAATVRACPLLESLSDEVAGALLPMFDYVGVARGCNVFVQGEPNDGHLFIVGAGRVILSRQPAALPRRIVAVHGPSAMFGELSVLDPGPREATATAATDACLARLSRDDLLAWTRAHNPAAERVLQLVARRLRTGHEAHVDLMQADARARVARLVLDLAGGAGLSASADEGVRHGLTQVQLAQAAGVSRESLNRVLHDFAVRGWLELFSYGFVVLDAQALWQRAGSPQWLNPAVTQWRMA